MKGFSSLAPATNGPQADDPMSALVFTCPFTGRDIVSGINTDMESLSHVQQLPVSLFCPHCGHVHRLVAKDGRLTNTASALKPEPVHLARL
jgi:hypothetical protein